MSLTADAVTVVVPAFNVERYLPDCLDSLVAQTAWPDCRVIVIDDGSTDSTPRIAADYAGRHPGISVLSQANAGPGAGAARNRGLDLVETEFVLFLDGDDELRPAAIEQLRRGLLAERLDLAVGATEQFPEPRSWLWSDYFSGESRSVRIEEVPLLAHDARTCNKLYRTSWLRSAGLRFAEGIHHQDTVVNVPAMLLADRFFLVCGVVHRYRKRAEGGSVMDNHFTRIQNFWDHLQVIEELSAMRPRFLPSREPLMQAFIARSFQGFSWRAPEVLPPASLPEFFRRSAAVIRTLDPGIIELATRDASQRVAYVTMLEDDFPSYLNLAELSQRVEVEDGDLYVAVPTTQPGHRRLLRAGATRAIAESVQADRHGVTVGLRVRIRGVTRPDLALAGMRLRGISAGEVAFGAAVTWRETEGSDSRATVFMPWSKLTAGPYLLRLRLRTPGGSFSRWLRRPVAEPAASGWIAKQRIVTSGARVELAATAEGQALLTVERGLLLRLRHQLGRLRRQLSRQAGETGGRP